MKKVFAALVAVLGSASMASAADLAARPYTKAPPVMVAPVFTWTGCYIGAHGGYGWGRNRNTFGDAVLANEGFDGTGAEFADQTTTRAVVLLAVRSAAIIRCNRTS